MTAALRLLIVEDRDDDVALLTRTLEDAGLAFEPERVRALDELGRELRASRWDLVLCDFRLIGFDATDALAVVREVDADLPFVVVSGVITDIEAAGIMREGANDFFKKGELGHLAESIRREVRDASARRAHEAERARFAAMVEHSAEWVALLDGQGTITYVSSSIRSLGHEVAELVGTPLLDLVHPDDATWAGHKLHAVHQGDQALERVEVRLRHGGDGHPVDAELLVQNLLDHEHVQALVVNARDVSSRRQVERQLRNSEAFVRTVLDSLAHATAVLDPVGTIVSVNRAWDHLVGALGVARPRARVGVDLLAALRASTASLDPERSVEAATAIGEVLADRQEAVEAELPVTSEDATRWFILRATQLAGGAGGAVVTLTDITAKHRVEQEQRRVLERHDELDSMKNAFLAAVSHELRTPLTSVRGVADSLVAHGDRITVGQRTLLYESLRRQSVRLEHLLGDLLDINRLTQGEVRAQRQPVDVEALVVRVLETGSVPRERVIVVGADLTVPLDGPMVERIVENLLVNALKFSPPDAPVTLTYEPAEGGVLVRVDDSGPGVAPEDRRRIFEPFQRADHPTVAGTGIGLTLVSRFATLHGGRAWVDDAPGGGARFQVLLPGVDAGTAAAGTSV
ncbi:MAG TPA: ATP-binding protein [Nitriliruptorales bacterium]